MMRGKKICFTLSKQKLAKTSSPKFTKKLKKYIKKYTKTNYNEHKGKQKYIFGT